MYHYLTRRQSALLMSYSIFLTELRKLFGHIMDKEQVQNGSSRNDDRKIIIYKSELDYMSKCILESPHIETGGNLFGLWTPFGIPFVQYVVGPGRNAEHHHTHFRQDFNFLDKNADLLVKEHALHHIGTWHSHHSLNLDCPSNGDSHSTLSGMRECHLKSFVLLIGNYRHGQSTVNAFRYYDDGRCVKLKWVVLDGESPVRHIYDKTHPSLVYAPQGTANMMNLEMASLGDNDNEATQAPVFEPDYWLSSQENKKEFAAIIKYLKSEFESVNIFQLDSTTIEVKMSETENVYKFVFDKTFPWSPPKLLSQKGNSINFRSVPNWDIEGKSISEAFINFYKKIEI